MRTARFAMLALLAGAAARADFSYTMTRHSSGAMAAAGEQATRYYLKGQKIMTDMGSMALLIDFETQTVTAVNKAQKTYTVTPFGQLGGMAQATPDVQVDFKETGQHKVINGFNASQAVMTMEMDQGAMKMQLEVEFWVSPDVPGAQELGAFYKRNAEHFPWTAVGAGGNPGMQKAMAAMQKRLAAMNGVPVMEIVRVKRPGGNDAQAQQMQAGMAQARARLEAMAAQGGPQGDAAKQALARMGGMAGGGSGALSETTMEGSAYSTSSIPDSVFSIPAGFGKAQR